MKTSFHYSILCAALLAVYQSPSLFAQDNTPPDNAPMGRLDALRASLLAEVTAIDITNREITLKGPQGNEETFEVGPAVKRLDEVKAGDFVRIDYLVSVAAELRPPTAEEAEHPLVIMGVGGRASDDSAPAGGVARRFKVVTTIVEVNMAAQTVTVQGPLGRTLTARVADPSRLAKAHVGDTVVIVYTEALALSLKKVDEKAAE
jgi:hypothetical protein